VSRSEPMIPTEAGAPRRVALRLFGEPSLMVDGRIQTLPMRAYWLVCLLAAEPGGQLRRGGLAQTFWPELGPEQAGANMRQFLARLRKQQEDLGVTLLAIDNDTIALEAELAEIDLLRFEREAGRPHGSADDLLGWSELYRGPLLHGVGGLDEAFEHWLAVARAQKRERLVGLLQAALRDAQQGGDADLVARIADRIFAIDPAQEEACLLLMQAELADGDRISALRLYQRCKAALEADLGARPSAALERLARPLLDGGGERLAAAPERRDEPVMEEGAGRAGRFPRLAILPPLMLQNEEHGLRLAAGLIEDVTVRLSRYRSFTILAPHTGLQLSARGETSATVDVDYLLTTMARRTTAGLSLSLRLATAKSGEVLWASEMEWRDDLLPTTFATLMNRITNSLIDAVERREFSEPVVAPNASAYRLYLEGQRSMSSIDLQAIRRARRWFRESLKQTERYAAPIVGIARSMTMEWLLRGLQDRTMLVEAGDQARQALAIDPFDWRALRERGLAALYLRRHEESLSFFEQAVLLGPNDADLHADHADALAFSGEPQAGLDAIVRAMELNPVTPGYYSWILGSILYQTHRYDEALEALKPVQDEVATARIMAACSARAGRMDQARRYAEVVRENYPGFRTEHIRQMTPNRRPDDMDHLIDGVRLAGLD
jgi:DNA-binding SARP family transcriptional activator/TolB-like protein